MNISKDLEAAILAQPFGSLSKRELELLLLKVLIHYGALPSEAPLLAAKTRITLTKAHSYLTDLALRENVLDDNLAVEQLIQTLRSSEVRFETGYIQFTLNNAALRLWIENKLAEHGLIQGETIRRDLIKISSKGLSVIISCSTRLPSPVDSINNIEEQFEDADWFSDFKKQAKPGISWGALLGGTSSLISIIQALIGSSLS